MRDYHRLLVWQRAHALAVEVARTTTELPRGGHASLQSQMVRATESIVLNIAEGCGADTQKEFARFLGIAIRSATELESSFELARDRGAVNQSQGESLRSELVEIRRMLYGLRARIRADMRHET